MAQGDAQRADQPRIVIRGRDPEQTPKAGQPATGKPLPAVPQTPGHSPLEQAVTNPMPAVKPSPPHSLPPNGISPQTANRAITRRTQSSMDMRQNKVGEFIGEGGMGCVYKLVRNTYDFSKPKFNVEYAIKFFYETDIDMIGSEAATAIHLRHRNLVHSPEFHILAFDPLPDPVKDRLRNNTSGRLLIQNGVPALVMDYVKGFRFGTDLRSWNRHFVANYDSNTGKIRPYLRPLSFDLFITWCVLGGLSEIKRNHWVHKDVKPNNIFISDQGIAQLGDFGLVNRATGPNMAMGTTMYMAPEQLRAEPLDEKADVYGLGMTLLECVLGCHPYDIMGVPVGADNKQLREAVYALSRSNKMREVCRPDLYFMDIPTVHEHDLRHGTAELALKMIHPDRDKRITIDDAIMATEKLLFGLALKVPGVKVTTLKLAGEIYQALDGLITTNNMARYITLEHKAYVNSARIDAGSRATQGFDIRPLLQCCRRPGDTMEFCEKKQDLPAEGYAPQIVRRACEGTMVNAPGKQERLGLWQKAVEKSLARKDASIVLSHEYKGMDV
jgi:serine/threonine protein kinase